MKKTYRGDMDGTTLGLSMSMSRIFLSKSDERNMVLTIEFNELDGSIGIILGGQKN